MSKQYQSDDIKELATALAKAQAEMKHAEKGQDNPFFKSKYADLPKVIDASRPFLAKHGLAVTQITDIEENGKMVLISQLMHSSGQWLRSWYPINPVKTDPQSLGSATTYARRYSYCSLTGVVAVDEDDDGNAASGNGNPAPMPARTQTARARNAEWQTIKDLLIGAGSVDELKMIWSANYAKIEAFRQQDPTFAEELEKTKDIRKAELTGQAKQDETLRAGMPEEFNNAK